MKIYIGADYHGLAKKELLKYVLITKGYKVQDEGAFEYQREDDYNDSAIAVAKNVREDHGSMGILICDSGHGMTIQANRFKGIRAANCFNPESAILARQHDDANVLCLSARIMEDEEAIDIVMAFLNTTFTEIERRVRRVNRLDEREDYD